MRCSESLPPLPPRFVAFAWRYHPVRLCSFLPCGPTPAEGLELSGLAAPHQPSGVETTGIPRFLENLRVYAMFSDPGGLTA
jgi:hypothetical protein